MYDERMRRVLSIVEKAGQLALHYYHQLTTLEVQEKKDQDFVSAADIAIEKYLMAQLGAVFPGDGFIGEEQSFTQRASGEMATLLDKNKDGYWIIDPIDGTTNFINHLNYWSIAIAYYPITTQAVTHAIIYQPVLDKMYVGCRHGGVMCNGRPLARIDRSLSSMQRKKSIVGYGTGTGLTSTEEAKIISFLKSLSVGYRKLSSCALMLTEVAAGSYNGYFEPSINSWDCLAGLMMVEELGGKVHRFIRTEADLFRPNTILVAVPDLYPLLEPLLQQESNGVVR